MTVIFNIIVMVFLHLIHSIVQLFFTFDVVFPGLCFVLLDLLFHPFISLNLLILEVSQLINHLPMVYDIVFSVPDSSVMSCKLNFMFSHLL